MAQGKGGEEGRRMMTHLLLGKDRTGGDTFIFPKIQCLHPLAVNTVPLRDLRKQKTDQCGSTFS